MIVVNANEIKNRKYLLWMLMESLQMDRFIIQLKEK